MERYRYRGPHITARRSRRGRIIWIVAAVLFLALTGLVIWTWVRTRAGEGYGAGRMEHSLGTEACPAVLLPAYPSPFRPNPDASGESEDPAETFSEAVTETPQGADVVYHSHKNDRMEIALSFDDGPHPRLTPVILSILEEYGIKATFFMVGENVGYYPDAARAVVEAGHEIGNHTFSHRRFNRMNEAQILEEIHDCEHAISEVSDAPIRFIRPPEGQMNETLCRVIGGLGYRIILWDVDTRDWAHTAPAEIARHILDNVQAGDIILMHDFIGHNSPTPEALRLVLPELLSRGYHFVTVGELVEGS